MNTFKKVARVPIVGLFLLVMTVNVSVLAAQALPNQQPSFVVTPGVVVDPVNGRLYSMNPEKGIDAVSLSSGQLLWTSDHGSKPLAVDGDFLLAQSERGGSSTELSIALLELASGGLHSSLTLELPQGARPSVEQQMGQSFDVQARAQDGRHLITWQFTERYVKGVAPEASEPLEQRQQGGFLLDPTTNEATVLSEIAKVEQPSALSDQVSFSRPHVLQLPSADNRHLLVTERHSPGDFDEYEWNVFALDSGELVGKLRHHQSHAPFFVIDTTIVFVERSFGHRVNEDWIEEPQKLVGALLGSGALVWERRLRDTDYRGPFPP